MFIFKPSKIRRFVLMAAAVLVALCMFSEPLFGVRTPLHFQSVSRLLAGDTFAEANRATVEPLIQDVLRKSKLSDKDEKKLYNYFQFDPADVKAIQTETLNQIHRSKQVDLGPDFRDWGAVAYVQYGTDPEHLCSAQINFQRLKQYKSKADFLFLYAGNKTEITTAQAYEYRMIKKVQATGATVKYVQPISLPSESSYWEKSFTKLYAFGLTQYERVIFLDSDALVTGNMDELFSLPDSVLAAPVNYINFRNFDKIPIDLKGAVTTPFDRTNYIAEFYNEHIEPEAEYTDDWLFGNIYPALPSLKVSVRLLQHYKQQYQLGSYLMVIHPDQRIFEALMDRLNHRTKDEYDMEIINDVFNLERVVETHGNFFKPSPKPGTNTAKFIPLVQVIPHNPYAMLSGELRQFQRSHDCYLADPQNLPELGYLYFMTESDNLETDAAGTIDDDDTNSFALPDLPYWSWYWDRRFTKFGWRAGQIMMETKLVHFSDTPLPKPWVKAPQIRDKFVSDALGTCMELTQDNKKGCEEELRSWTGLYDEYQRLVNDYC